jgi:hypothetical protein
MWNPYSLYFDRPELSHMRYEIRENYSVIVAVVNFVILFLLTVIMIIKLWKQKRLFIWAPLFSLLTLLLILHVQTYFPDSIREYTKDGYQYLEQAWYLKGNNTFKRFKSDTLLNVYSDHREIIWRLDTMYRR